MRNVPLNWCIKHAKQTPEQWKSIIFSDKNQVNMYGSDENQTIRRSKGGKYLPEFGAFIVKFLFYQMIAAFLLHQEVGRLHIVQGS